MINENKSWKHLCNITRKIYIFEIFNLVMVKRMEKKKYENGVWTIFSPDIYSRRINPITKKKRRRTIYKIHIYTVVGIPMITHPSINSYQKTAPLTILPPPPSPNIYFPVALYIYINMMCVNRVHTNSRDVQTWFWVVVVGVNFLLM